ncbi:hypothetical protein HUZ36_02970 [Pseudoalteromonas sp. McH1-7]|uniref:hypothetical protein n=1 Tax=Pseudoalteromonas sp. McH1-7 TaxID=2745574 RepID=UPI001592A49D|nr:hypothetical protein [Pseudoalteromonas sp. McH1-7]NUZ09737.1 hypothetical protein [Pseudoalteromonas sp. McH1-7]
MDQQDIEILTDTLANLRLQADINLAPKFPHFAGKPYPLGRCLEIRDEMFTLITAELKSNTQRLAILKNYMRTERTELKKVWGSLRDEYFQNAILVGDWYIDTANDTVNANKPRVEIKPISQSGFTAISHFEQFVKIARSYWQVDIYRNTAFPAIAPYLPLICVNEQGATWLAAANDDMIKVATESQFLLSEDILKQLPEPTESIVSRWQNTLLTLHEPDELLLKTGSPQAYCKKYRDTEKAADIVFRDKVVRAYMSLPKGA